jgi:hypothetical protein
MSEIESLNRSAIVGAKLSKVWQRRGNAANGFVVYSLFIELDNGIIFGLPYCDPDEPPQMVQASAEDLYGAEQIALPAGFHERVDDVVVSDYWPGVGIHLANGGLVYCTDNMVERYAGVCFDTIGKKYTNEDLRTIFH